MGEAHLFLFPEFLFLEFPLGEYDSRPKKHIRYYVIFFLSLLTPFQQSGKQFLGLFVQYFVLFQLRKQFFPAFLQHRIPRWGCPSSQIRYALKFILFPKDFRFSYHFRESVGIRPEKPRVSFHSPHSTVNREREANRCANQHYKGRHYSGAKSDHALRYVQQYHQ